MNAETRIPLFPLSVVLMPEMPLPLHIFEERYKKMIGECLEQSKEFGIVYLSDGNIKRVGCTARILKVLKRYENGEMDIVTMGKSRFFIKEFYGDKSYLEAKVVHFDDELEEESGELREIAREGMASLQELTKMTGIARDYGSPENLGLKRISFLISGSDGFTAEEKQELLEMTSTGKRLQSGVKALQKALERSRLNKTIEKIIKGNGQIRNLLEDQGMD